LKETPHSWLINKDPYDKNKYKDKKMKADSNSFRVYLCPLCKRVHENTYYNGEGRRTIFHKDFPTYKMTREVCTDCG
jgi:hypothetical protein